MRRTLIRLVLTATLSALLLIVGILISSDFGRNLLREEAERLLAPIMMGEVSIEALSLEVRGGIFLSGRNAKIYPRQGGWALTIEEVSAEIDLIELIKGRFELNSLDLGKLRFEIERDHKDRWNPYPISTLDTRDRVVDPDDLDQKLDFLEIFGMVAFEVLEEPLAARHTTVRDASVRLVDRYVRASAREPLSIEITGINGYFDHQPRDDTALLELSGELRGNDHPAVPIEALGEKGLDGKMQLRISVVDFPLSVVGDYFRSQDLDSRRASAEGSSDPRLTRPFSGKLTGDLRVETIGRPGGTLLLDWSARDLAIGFPRGDDLLLIDPSEATLKLRLDVHRNRLELQEIAFQGENIRIVSSGSLERPLVRSSPTRLSLHFYGAGIDEVHRVAVALPLAARDVFERILDDMTSGTITRIGGSGEAPFEVWRAIIQGDKLSLPPGIEFSTVLDDVSYASEGGEVGFSDFSGEFRWTGDLIRLIDIRARWQDIPLPELDLDIHGFSSLFDAAGRNDQLSYPSRSVAAIFNLDRIFSSAPESPKEGLPEFELPRIAISLERLDHPIFFGWPLRDLLLQLESEKEWLDFTIESGRWAGAQISGNLFWARGEENHIDAVLQVRPAAEPPQGETEADAPTHQSPVPATLTGEHRARGDDASWLVGDLHIDGDPLGTLPVEDITARFDAEGSRIRFTEIQAPIQGRGLFIGELALEVEQADLLEFELEFDIIGGDAPALLESTGFPRDFVTGEIDMRGRIGGKKRPNTPLLSEVDGFVTFHANDGEIHQEIPLVVSLANAIEGWDSDIAADTIFYETLDTEFRLDQGRIWVDPIKLEGPMRIFYTGYFDVGRPKRKIRGEIGIFLLRQMDQMLGRIPIVNVLIPGGKDKGLLGAYFQVKGTLEEPKLSPMPLRTLTEGIPLPEIIKAPFSLLRDVLRKGYEPDKSDAAGHSEEPKPFEEEPEEEPNPEIRGEL